MPPVQPGVTYEPESPAIPICPSLRGWPAPGTAALSGFPPTARDVAGSRSCPSQDLPACLAAGIWFAGRAGQARTPDSNPGNRRLASAIDSGAGRSHISPDMGCEAWKADGCRAISVQLATVKRDQSRILRVCEVGCSAASSAVICPIPKLTVRIRFPRYPGARRQVIDAPVQSPDRKQSTDQCQAGSVPEPLPSRM